METEDGPKCAEERTRPPHTPPSAGSSPGTSARPSAKRFKSRAPLEMSLPDFDEDSDEENGTTEKEPEKSPGKKEREMPQERGPGDDPTVDGWTEARSRRKIALLRAVEKAEHMVKRRNPVFESGVPGFEVEFTAADDKVQFRTDDLFKIFRDVQGVAAQAQPRLSPKGGIVVRVPTKSDVELVKSITMIAETEVVLVESAQSLWGRVTGVHPLFAEDDLREALLPQGIIDVVREKFSVCEFGTRVQKPSNRIRLKFGSEPRSDVTILNRVYRVTLCAASPMQCLKCCDFGHRAAKCPKRTLPRCRKCGAEGHQAWQCTARAKCINCKGAHASNSSTCPVYAVHAKAARDRFVGRVAAGLNSAVVNDSDFPELLPGRDQAPAAAGTDGSRPSFADVVGKAPTKALVQTAADGNRILCYLPRSPEKRRSQRRTAVREPKPRPPSATGVSTANLDAMIEERIAKEVAAIKEQVATEVAAMKKQVMEVRTELAEVMHGLLTSFKDDMRAMLAEMVPAVKGNASRDSIPGPPKPPVAKSPKELSASARRVLAEKKTDVAHPVQK